MSKSMPKSFAALILAGLALGGPAVPAAAQSSEPIRLSPEARDAVLEAAAARDDDALPINGASKIHGEVGIAVGSNGYREMYGSTVMPLGQTGVLGLSFSQGTYGNGRRR